MSKRLKASHPDQPRIPTLTAETRQKLVTAANEYGSLAPWTWMHDSELCGVCDPANGEILLCSVLGRLREVFALLVFRHDTGRRWVLNTILNDGRPEGLEDGESGFEQDCLKLEFVRKTELTEEDRAVHTDARCSPSIKRGCVWPVFRSFVPGCYPWYLTQAEAELLFYVLPRADAFARLLRERPNVGERRMQGEVPMLPDAFDPAAGPLRPEDLDWQPIIPAPDPPVRECVLDEATVSRLLKLPRTKGFHLELDLFYFVRPVADIDRPYFPKAALAVDRVSGFAGGLKLTESRAHPGAGALAEVLAGAMLKMGHRPETLRVQRGLVARMLAPAAKQLGIPVLEDFELPALNYIRAELEAASPRFGASL